MILSGFQPRSHKQSPAGCIAAVASVLSGTAVTTRLLVHRGIAQSVVKIPEFFHSPVAGHLGCFQCLAIMDVLLWTSLYKSLEVVHVPFRWVNSTNRTAGSQGEGSLALEALPNIFQSGCTKVRSQKQGKFHLFCTVAKACIIPKCFFFPFIIF